jgi:internalin A
LIIVDSRKDEKIEYWLKHIESFGGNSPVLVVINKIDENPGFDLNRTFIQDKYKNIQSFHRVSCLTLEGIKTLEDSIVKSMDNVRHLNTLWRSEWFDVKDDLQRINKDYISINHYLKICNKHLIKERAEQYELLSFLSDLGIMLNYQDLALHDTNVLNPRWITSAVYQIINSKVVADSHGTLQLSSLQSILDNDIYSISKHNYIISIMKKFELCYDLGNDRVLIPDLLKIEESESVIEPNIKFYIQYNFLPKSIIPRFIVRMHKNIKEGDNWRTGAVLNSQHYSSKAIVKSDEEDRKIIILVEGGQARDFFNIIRDTLENINVSFEKLQYEERVVVPKTNVSISHKHLLLLERMGRDEYLPEGTSEPISVSEVLGTVTVTEKEKLENRILQHLIFLREKFNDKDTILSEVNKIIEIKPNIAGIGINVNALLEKLFKK